jgi:mRNA-degrading endonuclease RelE of RelBE toxin-antitoxin system
MRRLLTCPAIGLVLLLMAGCGFSKPLLGELEGLRSARRGDYRMIYEIFEDAQIVLIHRVQHRRDVDRPR